MPAGDTLAVSVVVRPGKRLMYGEALKVITGLGFTVTLVAAEVAEHPLALVTVTV